MYASIALPAYSKLSTLRQINSRQRRKGPRLSPYVNHLIEVAELLAREGGVTDLMTLQAAILHDTLRIPRPLQQNSTLTSVPWCEGSWKNQ